jgi:hypothetical protein
MSLTELDLLDGRRPLPLGDVIGLTLTLSVAYNKVTKKGNCKIVPVLT